MNTKLTAERCDECILITEDGGIVWTDQAGCTGTSYERLPWMMPSYSHTAY